MGAKESSLEARRDSSSGDEKKRQAMDLDAIMKQQMKEYNRDQFYKTLFRPKKNSDKFSALICRKTIIQSNVFLIILNLILSFFAQKDHENQFSIFI
jgi:hypothetical protein